MKAPTFTRVYLIEKAGSICSLSVMILPNIGPFLNKARPTVTSEIMTYTPIGPLDMEPTK